MVQMAVRASRKATVLRIAYLLIGVVLLEVAEGRYEFYRSEMSRCFCLPVGSWLVYFLVAVAAGAAFGAALLLPRGRYDLRRAPAMASFAGLVVVLYVILYVVLSATAEQVDLGPLSTLVLWRPVFSLLATGFLAPAAPLLVGISLIAGFQPGTDVS